MHSPSSLKVGVRILLFSFLDIQPRQLLFFRRHCAWPTLLVAPVNQLFRSQACSLPLLWMGRRSGGPLPGHQRKRERQPSSGAWSSEDDASSGAWQAPRRRKTRCKATQVFAPHAQSSVGADHECDSGAWSDNNHDSGAWSDCADQLGIPPPPCIDATGLVDGSDLLEHALCRVGKDTTYSKDGRCRNRIRTLLAMTHSASACVCKAPCFLALSVGVVGALADAYWSMSDEERAVIIHSMYTTAACNSEGHLQVRRIKWTIQHHGVCFKMFCALLGTSENTVRKYIRGDWVPKLVFGRARTAGMCVDFFFQSLYQSTAEPLPHNQYTTAQKTLRASRPPGAACDPDCLLDDGTHMWAGQPMNPGEDQEDTELSLERPVVELQASLAQLAQSPAADVGLPVRYLPHNPLIHHYWVFVSSWAHILASAQFDPQRGSSSNPHSRVSGFIPCPSYKTFNRRYQQVWERYLRIRKWSQHAMCNTCYMLQQQMHGAKKSMQVRLTTARALRQHYQDQYADRCLYWALRHASRVFDNVLVIIIDSMDKTKFAWPRYPWPRISKDVGGIPRPRLIFTAAIAHGLRGMLKRNYVHHTWHKQPHKYRGNCGRSKATIAALVFDQGRLPIMVEVVYS